MLHVPRIHQPGHVLPHYAPALLGTTAAMLAAFVGLLSSTTPFTMFSDIGQPTHQEVVNVLTQYIDQWEPSVDPLIAVGGVGDIKTSNVEGVMVNGHRYYYRFVNSFSYDPLSRGEAKDYCTVEVLDPGTQFEVQIYQLTP